MCNGILKYSQYYYIDWHMNTHIYNHTLYHMSTQIQNTMDNYI